MEFSTAEFISNWSNLGVFGSEDIVMKKKNHKKGFTLVELVVVLVILAILMAILVPSLIGYINKSKMSEFEMHRRNVKTAINSVMAEQLKNKDMKDLNFDYAGVRPDANPIAKQLVEEIEELSECGPDRYIYTFTVQKGKLTTILYIDEVAKKRWFCEYNPTTGKVEMEFISDLP